MEGKDKKIRDYIAGNRLVVEAVVEDFSAYIAAICRNFPVPLSNEDTEEIAADVVLTVWRNQYKLDRSKPMFPYIAGITRNLLRKKCRDAQPTEGLGDYEETLVSRENLEIRYIEKEQSKAVLRQVEKLRPDDKTILLQYYYEEKSIRQIADGLHISESRVKSRLFRIRKKLKKYLETEVDFDGE